MKKAELGNAKWVSAEGRYCSPLMRKLFFAEGVKQAVITIACLGFFEGYINGEQISGDKFLSLSTDYHKRNAIDYCGEIFDEKLEHRLYCPVYDITHLLKSGKNVVGFMLGPGWYERSGDACGYGNVKLCFNIEITHYDGTKDYVVSDEKIRIKQGFVKKCDILNGETQDYRGYDDNWPHESFDDSTWEYAHIEPPPETRLFIQDCPADRVIRSVNVKLIHERNGVRIYDAGEILSGYPVFSVEDGFDGEINIRYGELLNAEGTLAEDNIYLQHTDIINNAKARKVHSRFTWMCFRYFEVRGECQIDKCLVIHSDVRVTSGFNCDDDTLNWLYDAYVRTQLANMHCGIPSDCPHIERKGYTGDGQLTCKAAMTFLNAKSFYRKWIYDISDCQDRRTGHVQYTAPFLTAGGGPGGWGGAIVFVPYEYYRHYKDKALLDELYPQMIRYFDYMEQHSENELVISDRKGAWCLGEWCTPEQLILNDRDGVKLPPPFVNTYFYIKAMTIVLKIEDIIDKHGNGDILAKRIVKKKAAMTAEYFNEKSGDFCSGVQGANAFAVDIGIGDERTVRSMAEHYRLTGHYDTGIFGTDIVTRTLFERGYSDIALKLLTSKDTISFYNQKRTGASTILENWNGVRSQCHPMFGAVSVYLSEYILGIQQTEGSAGYEQIVIRPMCMDTVYRASGYITTEKGIISVDYNEEEINVKAPADVLVRVEANNRRIYMEKSTLQKEAHTPPLREAEFCL